MSGKLPEARRRGMSGWESALKGRLHAWRAGNSRGLVCSMPIGCRARDCLGPSVSVPVGSGRWYNDFTGQFRQRLPPCHVRHVYSLYPRPTSSARPWLDASRAPLSFSHQGFRECHFFHASKTPVLVACPSVFRRSRSPSVPFCSHASMAPTPSVSRLVCVEPRAALPRRST